MSDEGNLLRSHNAAVESPLTVINVLVARNDAAATWPLCPSSTRGVFASSLASGKVQTVHTLSRPPVAHNLEESWAQAANMAHWFLRGNNCAFRPLGACQMITLPSCAAVANRFESGSQLTETTLPKWPLRDRLFLSF